MDRRDRLKIHETMRPRAVVFDAYGTLFDIQSGVLRAANNIRGDLHSLSRSWRQRQLEYTWLLSLMGRYEDFWSVTQTALRSTLTELQIDVNEGQLNTLLQAYLCPFVFPDVIPALEGLRKLPRVILSNGSAKMLESAIQHNALESMFAEIISVDRVQVYKPSPRVYVLGTEILCLSAAEILFVSSNWWDAWGAKAFGYNVCWCNRAKSQSEFLNDPPDFVVTQLDQIADHLGNNRSQ